MSKADYYQTLNVERNASKAELKQAFRRLAMKYHPDRNPGNPEAEEKFKEIKEAYEVLVDDQQRRTYDQFGHAGVDGMRGAGGFGTSAGFSDFGDIFSEIFGGKSSSRAQAGADLRYLLEITLEEAVRGCTKKIDIPNYDACESCEGSGAKKGSSPATCSTCQGSGQLRIQQGFLTIQQTCPHCRGAGSIIKDPCPDCHGQGRKKVTKELKVEIPAGIDTGDRIRLSGEGEAGTNGGPQGDLYVQIEVERHAVFARDGKDLHCEMPIDFVTCALGGELEIPTLEGHANLKIPAETQSGKVFRLRGKGVQSVHGSSRGDLFCKITIETPVHLSEKQQDLLKEFSESLAQDGKDHSPQSKSWFDKVKNFFEKM